MAFKEFWMRKRLGLWFIVLLVVVSLLVWSQVVIAQGTGNLIVKIYDIGQGDSIFIQTPGGYRILVDGGYNNRVVDHLNRDLGVGERSLDLVILTHPDADHLYGLVEVIRKFAVKKVITTKATSETALFKLWQDTLKSKSLAVENIYAGDSITLNDSTVFNFVWPTPEGEVALKTNASGIVFALTYGTFDMLLTGDTGAAEQPYSGNIGEIEVLKVPHHGSKTGLEENFLEQLSPEISVISVGERNTYGHPAENILEMLDKIDSKVYRTDKNGTIEIVATGETWYTRSDK